MSHLMQYLGNAHNGKTMIFANITYSTFKVAENDYRMLSKENLMHRPIPVDRYQEIIKSTPTSGRYEVSKLTTTSGDHFYYATEAHRDAYPYHLPGYKFISQLEIGCIIPIYGFNEELFLSEIDKLLLKDRTKFNMLYHECVTRR